MAIEEAVIGSSAGAGDFLALRAEPWNGAETDYYEGPSVEVELACGRLRALSVLPASVVDAHRLARLFHEIDRDWRGWPGEKVAGHPEGWFACSATHGGRGHVSLTVRLADNWPMGWSSPP